MAEDERMPNVTIVQARFDEATRGDVAHIPIPRDWHEDAFHEMLTRIGCDGYGIAQQGTFLTSREVRFEDDDPKGHLVVDTPLFTLRPYYWGDDHEVASLPNFTYKPWDYNVSWYKWPMRDAYANFELSDDDWRLMLDTVATACERRPAKDERWLEGVDDLPRMSEAQAVAWEMRKRLTKAWDRANELEDALYVLAMRVPIADERLREDVIRLTGIEPEDLASPDPDHPRPEWPERDDTPSHDDQTSPAGPQNP